MWTSIDPFSTIHAAVVVVRLVKGHLVRVMDLLLRVKCVLSWLELGKRWMPRKILVKLLVTIEVVLILERIRATTLVKRLAFIFTVPHIFSGQTIGCMLPYPKATELLSKEDILLVLLLHSLWIGWHFSSIKKLVFLKLGKLALTEHLLSLLGRSYIETNFDLLAILGEDSTAESVREQLGLFLGLESDL